MRVVKSDRMRALLRDPEGSKQLREWMATGKPEQITFRENGKRITVRPRYVPVGGA